MRNRHDRLFRSVFPPLVYFATREGNMSRQAILPTLVITVVAAATVALDPHQDGHRLQVLHSL
jgi:hypothetical protein